MSSKLSYVKTYIDVIVKMRTDGAYIPVKVLWEDREFEVDKVIRISQSPPQYVGAGPTIKHTVLIGGKEKNLYLEENPRRWFIEKPIIQF